MLKRGQKKTWANSAIADGQTPCICWGSAPMGGFGGLGASPSTHSPETGARHRFVCKVCTAVALRLLRSLRASRRYFCRGEHLVH